MLHHPAGKLRIQDSRIDQPYAVIDIRPWIKHFATPVDPWLDGSAEKDLLVPAPESMLRKWPVSQRINSSRTPGDDPTLIAPIELAA